MIIGQIISDAFLSDREKITMDLKRDIREKVTSFMALKDMSIQDMAKIFDIPQYEADSILIGNGNISIETLVGLIVGFGYVLNIIPYDEQNEVKYRYLELKDKNYSKWNRYDIVQKILERNLENECDIDEDSTSVLRYVLIKNDLNKDEEMEESNIEDNTLLNEVRDFISKNPDLKKKLRNALMED